jgi:transcriptional regulator GlxA family with amidase domain
VPLAGGAQWHADAAFNDAIACDWLIVVSERFQQFADYRLFLASLARVGQRTPVVSGIHHGVVAGDGRAVVRVSRGVNWETYQQFAEQFERSIVTQQIFEIDRDRATCAGGQATVDFMLAMIGREHGADLAERIADALGAGTLRSGDERQRIPFVTAPGERHPRLNDALLLMEANIEDPLTTDEIAGHVGVSRRQLERLFRQYLGRCRRSITSIFGCEGAYAVAADQQVGGAGQSRVWVFFGCAFFERVSRALRRDAARGSPQLIERQHGGANEPRAGALVEPPA